MIITCIVMLIVVLITHRFTIYLGLNLQIKPLLLCALCALFINFTLPSISVYIARFQLLVIFSIILGSAILITYYNEQLNLVATPAEPVTPITPPSCAENSESIPSLLAVTNSPPVIIPLPAEPPAVIPILAMLPSPPTPLTQTFKKLGKVLHIKSAVNSANLPSIIVPTIGEIVTRDMENAKLIKLTAVLAKLSSLDAILDYAYEQKTLRAYSNAIFAFKQALECYQTDDYAPFIAIEVGNIYKNTGLYDEAIVIYNRAFSLTAVMQNIDLQTEFQNNISYLRILKTILLKYNSCKLAFSKIPPAILQEIENEFALWRTQKYAS